MSAILIGNWIIPQEDFGGICPIFRKQFRTTKTVKTATLYMTALGLYQPMLNGQRITSAALMPGWTSYDKRVQYQEFDLTPFLKEENELQVLLGKGWCAGKIAWSGKQGYWNDVSSLIGSVEIAYTDGTSELYITDKDWQVAKSGILFSEIYDGETFDSNIISENFENVQIYPHTKEVLIEQEGEWIQEFNRLKPISKIITPKGEVVLDFGQNLTGYVEFKITGQKGASAIIRHAEVLDKDGNFYTDNLRTAKQQITYICNGTQNTYKPHFTFQGFRYIQLIDWPDEIALENFTAIVVHSDLKRTGKFSCSEPKLNQLYQNIIWGQLGNFVDVPTDCPQRDERLGWTGDAQVFIGAACYNYDVNRFFVKWLHDLKADQEENGSVPAVIPDALGKTAGKEDSVSGSSAWGDAAVICPWQLYRFYGNKEILEEQFDSMRRWIEYIRAQGDNEFLWNTGHHFGDWLGLDAEEGSYEGATDKGLIATAFFAYSTSLFIKVGNVLNKDMSVYEDLYNSVLTAFQETYLVDGKPICETQTAYVLALVFDLSENKRLLSQELARLVTENGNRLTTGFVGTPYLLHVLSDNGYEDLAYSLLLQEEFPSWLYSVNQGATTIWEHWDGIRPDGSMWSKDMNSFNHYAYGAVADWMYGVMAGIKPCESKPGFQKIIIEPIADSRVRWVKASVETENGTIRSEWKHVNGNIVYTIEVPDNSVADIYLDGNVYHVTGGLYSYRIISR